MDLESRRAEPDKKRHTAAPSASCSATQAVGTETSAEYGKADSPKEVPLVSSTHSTVSVQEAAVTGFPSSPAPPVIDTDLYSRQIGAYGFETMGKLIKMKVLICGLGGVGVEIAKNLILAGPKTVALFDESPPIISDLASNFCLTEEDVKNKKISTRSAAVCSRLAALNEYVTTTVLTGITLDLEVIRKFDLIVVSEMKMSQMIEINNICRTAEPCIGFIAVDVFGLCGSMFVDFGPEFTVFDKDGEPVKSALVEEITQESSATVRLNEDRICPFSPNTFVRFSEVQGMTELNNCQHPFKIKSTSKFSFVLDFDTTKFSPYTMNGIVHGVKVPSKLCFKSLEHCVKRPIPEGTGALICPDMAKFNRTEMLHFAIQAIYVYQETHGSLPKPRDSAAVAECVGTAKKLNEEARDLLKQINQNSNSNSSNGDWLPVSVEEIEPDVIRSVAEFACCRISPMCAFFGGVVSQEIVKFTGKFTPFRQWLYFDAFECLPSKAPENTTLLNCRYDDQIAIWGADFQKRLGQMKIFLVGAGALGCELLKSFALMGLCTKEEKGSLTLADMDRIEISNLNRQFLFKRHHVGSSKSLTAAQSALLMNSAINIVATETRVGVETEEQYDDQFWSALDLVVNALDNIQSRLYIDRRCVWFHKPLLESGTLGTKANSQVILPKMTQTYGDSQDPPEDSIPLCTLRHFPNQIEHTIEWARDAFQGVFCDGPREAAACAADVTGFLAKLQAEGTSATQRERLAKINSLLSTLNCKPTIEDCVTSAVQLFDSYFNHQIAQLLYTFPLDHVTAAGALFWSGPKRAPQVIQFDSDDILHLMFIVSCANLFAFNLGIPQERNIDTIRQMANKVSLEPFKPKVVRIKVDEHDTTVEGAADDEGEKESLGRLVVQTVKQLQQQNKGGDLLLTCINPVEFEKDEDSNFHVDFIWSCANLRARNYRIAECDKHKAKMISGKIVPAIATTTAMITGLIGLELLKTIDYKDRKLVDFKNAFINLSTPLILLSEPMPPLQSRDKDYDPIAGGPVKARPVGFTSWDFLEFTIPNATVKNLIDAIESSMNVEVSILSVGHSCLYNGFLKSHNERKSRNVKQLIETITKCRFPAKRNCVAIDASCSDEDGIDVIIPTIRLTF